MHSSSFLAHRGTAITTAVNWYVQHLKATKIPIIFISSEKQDFTEARDDYLILNAHLVTYVQGNVRVMTMAAYLEQFYSSHAELRELCESLQSVALEEEHAPPRTEDDTNLAITRHPQTGYFEVRSPRCLASM